MLLAKLAEIENEDARAARAIQFCPYDLYPRQQEFVDLQAREALYGGATRGGKTIALLASALKYVDRPGYNAIIFRKTLSDLRNSSEALIPKLHEWLGSTAAQWSEQHKTWSFPSGARLQLAGLDNERLDIYKFQGGSYQFIAFDEICHFKDEYTYQYLFSRQSQDAKSDIPLRMRATANPGGPGAKWVKERFLMSASPKRVYVPSIIEDNLSINATSLRESLSHLDETTRRQLGDGEWLDDGGDQIFKWDRKINLYEPSRNERPFVSYHLGVDYGYTHASAFSVLGIKADDPTVYVVEALKKAELLTDQAAQVVKDLDKRYRFSSMVGDQGGMGKTYQEEMRRRFQLPIEAADKRPGYKGPMMRLMKGYLARGLIKVDPIMAEPLLKEWASVRWNDESDDVASGSEDHLLDATLYGWQSCFNYHAEPPPPPMTEAERIHAQTEAWHREDEQRRQNPQEWWEEDY